MNDNKGQTIFLSVIGIATLLVAIVGATFAWFSAGVSSNSESSILIRTAEVASVTFVDGAQISNNNILPGWSAEKEFTVSHPGGNTVDQKFIVYLNWTHTKSTEEGRTVATDLAYTLTSTSTDSAGGELTTPVAINVEQGALLKSKIAEKTITGTAASPAAAWSGTYTLTLNFPETYTSQDAQQGASFNAYVSVELDGAGTMYYNTSNPTGTPSQPENPNPGT